MKWLMTPNTSAASMESVISQAAVIIRLDHSNPPPITGNKIITMITNAVWALRMPAKAAAQPHLNITSRLRFKTARGAQMCSSSIASAPRSKRSRPSALASKHS
jgi:hypothetical protein